MPKSTLIVIIVSMLAITLILAEVQAQTGGAQPGFVELMQSFAALDKSDECRLTGAQKAKVLEALEKISAALEEMEKSDARIESTLTKDQIEYIQALSYSGRISPVIEPPILDQISAESDPVIIEAIKSLQKTGTGQAGRPAEEQ